MFDLDAPQVQAMILRCPALVIDFHVPDHSHSVRVIILKLSKIAPVQDKRVRSALPLAIQGATSLSI